MTFNFTFRNLFESLEGVPGLQRKDWELNQSGVDRGMESVLIQRTAREVATYALVQLRFAAMPELVSAAGGVADEKDGDGLIEWARSQGPGGSMMIKTAVGSAATNDRSRVAAMSVLKYYHKREDENPAVKAGWTDEGLRRVPSLDIAPLLQYPTSGAFWENKYDTVQRLVQCVLGMDTGAMTDDQVMRDLRSIKGVGPQTASMVSLFWLQRPVPIIDGYLTKMLSNHGLVTESLACERAQDELRVFLTRGASEMAAERPEWPVHRSLSSLYLWACEVGRFICTCGQTPSPDCPVKRVIGCA